MKCVNQTINTVRKLSSSKIQNDTRNLLNNYKGQRYLKHYCLDWVCGLSYFITTYN